MAEFPALPLWTDAYLADTSHLSDAEHGRYLIMLFHMWRMPMARFPADDVWLARKFNRSPEVFASEWKPLMQEYMHSDGNWWTQRKMQRVYRKLFAIREKNSAAANARWEKEKEACKRNASKTKTKTPDRSKKAVGAIATRWHPDAQVSSEWMGDAQVARLHHGLTEIDVRLEAEKFANYWSSKSGAQATKLDWHKTWINWILKAEAPRHGKNGKGPSAHDKFFAGVDAAIRETLGGQEPAAPGGDNVVAGPFGRPLLPR